VRPAPDSCRWNGLDETIVEHVLSPEEHVIEKICTPREQLLRLTPPHTQENQSMQDKAHGAALEAASWTELFGIFRRSCAAKELTTG